MSAHRASEAKAMRLLLDDASEKKIAYEDVKTGKTLGFKFEGYEENFPLRFGKPSKEGVDTAHTKRTSLGTARGSGGKGTGPGVGAGAGPGGGDTQIQMATLPAASPVSANVTSEPVPDEAQGEDEHFLKPMTAKEKQEQARARAGRKKDIREVEDRYRQYHTESVRTMVLLGYTTIIALSIVLLVNHRFWGTTPFARIIGVWVGLAIAPSLICFILAMTDITKGWYGSWWRWLNCFVVLSLLAAILHGNPVGDHYQTLILTEWMLVIAIVPRLLSLSFWLSLLVTVLGYIHFILFVALTPFFAATPIPSGGTTTGGAKIEWVAEILVVNAVFANMLAYYSDILSRDAFLHVMRFDTERRTKEKSSLIAQLSKTNALQMIKQGKLTQVLALTQDDNAEIQHEANQAILAFMKETEQQEPKARPATVNMAVSGMTTIRQWVARMRSAEENARRKRCTTEIFLGGSCNPTTWRRDTAIPMLEQQDVTFYNPQVDNWTPELVKIEAAKKEEARLLLFVIDDQTRALSSLLESVEYICSGRAVVLVLKFFNENSMMDGQPIPKSELKDNNRSRSYLAEIAERHGIACFNNVEDAIRKCIRVVKSPSEEDPAPRLRAAPALGQVEDVAEEVDEGDNPDASSNDTHHQQQEEQVRESVDEDGGGLPLRIHVDSSSHSNVVQPHPPLQQYLSPPPGLPDPARTSGGDTDVDGSGGREVVHLHQNSVIERNQGSFSAPPLHSGSGNGGDTTQLPGPCEVQQDRRGSLSVSTVGDLASGSAPPSAVSSAPVTDPMSGGFGQFNGLLTTTNPSLGTSNVSANGNGITTSAHPPPPIQHLQELLHLSPPIITGSTAGFRATYSHRSGRAPSPSPSSAPPNKHLGPGLLRVMSANGMSAGSSPGGSRVQTSTSTGNNQVKDQQYAPRRSGSGNHSSNMPPPNARGRGRKSRQSADMKVTTITTTLTKSSSAGGATVRAKSLAWEVDEDDREKEREREVRFFDLPAPFSFHPTVLDTLPQNEHRSRSAHGSPRRAGSISLPNSSAINHMRRRSLTQDRDPAGEARSQGMGGALKAFVGGWLAPSPKVGHNSAPAKDVEKLDKLDRELPPSYGGGGGGGGGVQGQTASKRVLRRENSQGRIVSRQGQVPSLSARSSPHRGSPQQTTRQTVTLQDKERDGGEVSIHIPLAGSGENGASGNPSTTPPEQTARVHSLDSHVSQPPSIRVNSLSSASGGDH